MKALTFAMPLMLAGLLLAPAGAGDETPASGSASVPDLVRWMEADIMYFAWPASAIGAGSISATLATPIEDAQAEAPEPPNDPHVELQWGLEQIRHTEASGLGTGGEGVLVAILDTGVDPGHEDLAGRVVVSVNFSGSPYSDDVLGHGTHVAGIAAAGGNNALGITGIAPESLIMSVKIADDRGVTRTTTVARGIVWAVDNGARVINVSVEFAESTTDLAEAVEYAWAKGAVIVAAAGNQGSQDPVYPAYYESVIAVAGSTRHGALAPLSNFGAWVDAVAPGFDIYSTLPGDTYGYRSGTSFATAHVSGLAALLFAMAVDENGNGRVNDEVRTAIEEGSRDFEAMTAGQIDVPTSVNWLRQP